MMFEDQNSKTIASMVLILLCFYCCDLAEFRLENTSTTTLTALFKQASLKYLVGSQAP